MITRFKSKNLYWQTDNVATTSIIGSGSNKVKLQNMALEIYDLTCNKKPNRLENSQLIRKT